MPTIYPLDFPDQQGTAGLAARPVAAVASSMSPFTLQKEIQVHQGQKWQYLVSLPLMSRAEAEPWISFLLKLNGMQGTFLMSPSDAMAPQGVAAGAPVVAGAGQTGQTLLTSGWTVSTADILKAGDYISIGSSELTRLHKVLDDVASDAAGLATLDIWPRLRETPVDLSAISTIEPKGIFRLSGNEMPFSVDAMLKYTGLDFGIEEAI